MRKIGYYQGIVNAVQEPILVFDRAMRIVDFNEAAAKAFGRNPSSARNCPCHGETEGPGPYCAKTKGQCTIRQVFETGRFVRAIRRNEKPDGSVAWEEILASPVRNEDGEVEYVVEELRDLTEVLQHRRLVKELQSQVHRLEGLLPICCHCKKIRTTDGRWEEVDHYVHKRTQVDFTHGVCPDCLVQHYPEPVG